MPSFVKILRAVLSNLTPSLTTNYFLDCELNPSVENGRGAFWRENTKSLKSIISRNNGRGELIWCSIDCKFHADSKNAIIWKEILSRYGVMTTFVRYGKPLFLTTFAPISQEPEVFWSWNLAWTRNTIISSFPRRMNQIHELFFEKPPKTPICAPFCPLISRTRFSTNMIFGTHM